MDIWSTFQNRLIGVKWGRNGVGQPPDGRGGAIWLGDEEGRENRHLS